MHDHAHGPGGGIRSLSNRRLLAISLAITALVMVVQIVGSALSGSLALLADAGHMFADAAALVIALIASSVAARPADDRRTFGYQRAEVLGALVNGAILVVLAVWIAVEAVQRLMAPAQVEVAGGLMLLVAVVGLVGNSCALWLLSSAQRTSINVRGAYLEVLGDLLGSAAVIIAAVLVLTTGWMQADAVASLLIAAMIVPRAIGLLREVVSVLSESSPRDVQVQTIREHILSTPGSGRRARPARLAAHSRRSGAERARRGRGGVPERRALRRDPGAAAGVPGPSLRRRPLDVPARARRPHRARRARLTAAVRES